MYELLEDYIRKGCSEAVARSIVNGRRKYQEKWKEDDWQGMLGLVDVKTEMFFNLVKQCDPTDPVSVSEVRHHYADMIAWFAIIGLRAEMGWTQQTRETVIVKALEKYPDLIEGYNQGELISDIVKLISEGKRVVIE